MQYWLKQPRIILERRNKVVIVNNQTTRNGYRLANEKPQWSESRKIMSRIIVEGQLVLTTPAQFGNGDSEGPTDMPLLLDPLKGNALLTGATIAGALRSYLVSQEWAGSVQDRRGWATMLFGGEKSDDEGEQSPLIIDDAIGDLPSVEIRDGVMIDPETGTAVDGNKFDMELLQAGTRFPLRFELLVCKHHEDAEAKTGVSLKQPLALALNGLSNGHLNLGTRKRRGLGACKVESWQVYEYDLTTLDGLSKWISNEKPEPNVAESIGTKLGVTDTDLVDQRQHFHLRAKFWLDSTLLIRSGTKQEKADVEQMHQTTKGSNVRVPIIPGTSLAGVIRHRALRIAQTLHGVNGTEHIDHLFGSGPSNSDKKTHTGSRVSVQQATITGVKELIQNRIRIDRFTGGVLDNYLFSEVPVFGGPNSIIHVDIIVRQPTHADIGLLLLVLKDLWTADLPVGGGANIGRGRLHGRTATLSFMGTLEESADTNSSTSSAYWELIQEWSGRTPGKLEITSDASYELQDFVDAYQPKDGVSNA